MISALICCAGTGSRTGFSQNKLFTEIEGLPVLVRTVSAFAGAVDEIVVACREEDESRMKSLLSPFQVRLVLGGETRTQTVKKALEAVHGEIVLVHDGARPYVSSKIIRDCIASVKEFGSGICALPATDTTVLTQNGCIVAVPPREQVYTVQTPQGFVTEELRLAYAKAEGAFTDESSLYAAYVRPPHFFLGERSNKKLTFAEDFAFPARVGFGVDTHAFATEKEESPFITLGGVHIPAAHSLVAHSDGDVLVHALMDALLSAAGLRDIGYYFPDTEEKFKGADSMRLLDETLHRVREAGFVPNNVSLSILAQTPRLSPYIEEMRKNLSSALALPCNAVAVAAGTNEHLGYVGEGKGITVYAYVTVKEK